MQAVRHTYHPPRLWSPPARLTQATCRLFDLHITLVTCGASAPRKEGGGYPWLSVVIRGYPRPTQAACPVALRLLSVLAVVIRRGRKDVGHG